VPAFFRPHPHDPKKNALLYRPPDRRSEEPNAVRDSPRQRSEIDAQSYWRKTRTSVAGGLADSLFWSQITWGGRCLGGGTTSMFVGKHPSPVFGHRPNPIEYLKSRGTKQSSGLPLNVSAPAAFISSPQSAAPQRACTNQISHRRLRVFLAERRRHHTRQKFPSFRRHCVLALRRKSGRCVFCTGVVREPLLQIVSPTRSSRGCSSFFFFAFFIFRPVRLQDRAVREGIIPDGRGLTARFRTKTTVITAISEERRIQAAPAQHVHGPRGHPARKHALLAAGGGVKTAHRRPTASLLVPADDIPTGRKVGGPGHFSLRSPGRTLTVRREKVAHHMYSLFNLYLERPRRW